MCSSVSASRSDILGNRLKEQISRLRHHGKSAHTAERYFDAIKCYTAILQLVEGLPGQEAYEMRRRCGLNLAYCELKTQNYGKTVARCSEVIDESSNYLAELNGELSSPESQQLLRESLSKAHQRRGMALKFLNKLDLAEMDFQTARDYRNKGKQKKVRKLSRISLKEEVLQDFADECQVTYPRSELTSRELAMLSKASEKSSSLMDSSRLSDAPTATLPGFPDMGGFGALMEGESLFDGKVNYSSIVRTFGPMLGLSERTVTIISKVLDVIDSMSKSVAKVTKFLNRNKESMIIGATLLWLLYISREELFGI